jgi:hypothetical protein
MLCVVALRGVRVDPLATHARPVGPGPAARATAAITCANDLGACEDVFLCVACLSAARSGALRGDR